MPTREFRVDDFGAPDYPELVLATSKETLETEPDLVADVVAALGEGSREAVADPERALSALIASAPALERAEQRAQLDALIDAGALSGDVGLDRSVLEALGGVGPRAGNRLEADRRRCGIFAGDIENPQLATQGWVVGGRWGVGKSDRKKTV